MKKIEWSEIPNQLKMVDEEFKQLFAPTEYKAILPINGGMYMPEYATNQRITELENRISELEKLLYVPNDGDGS